MEKFTQYCKEFYKRDIKVKIIGEKPENNSNSKKTKTSANRNNQVIEGRSDLPRPVQDVLQIFQGEIKTELSTYNNNKNDID